MLRVWFSLLVFGGALVAQGPVEPQRTLRLEDVFESVKRHYPPLLAALKEREIADADVLNAEGRFDLVLRARTDSDSLGYYSNRRFDFGVDQPLAFQGMTLSSGYRVGVGDFAPYDGKLLTRSNGEFRTGVRMPLVRDRSIDNRRGELAKARIGRKLADLSIDQQRLLIMQSAARRYWDWVAAGRRLELMRAVLNVAETRQRFVEESTQAGQLAAIEVAENRRAILQRQSQVVEAERLLQQAAIELSLFYRDAGGNPVIPSVEQVPAQFLEAAELSESRFQSDLETALNRRPEIARLRSQRDQLDVDVRLAKNQRRPLVDVVAGFTSESGTGPVQRGPQEFRAGIAFELPWQNRSAEGRLKSAEARAGQLALRERFLRDQVAAEVRDAASALKAAWQRYRLIAEEVEVARQLEDAERVRFELGEGTLFMLNLREIATADAILREIAAHADYHRAYAAYEFTTAELLLR